MFSNKTFPITSLLKSIDPNDLEGLCDLHKRAWHIACGLIDDIPDWHSHTLDNYDIDMPDLLGNYLIGLAEVTNACRISGLPIT